MIDLVFAATMSIILFSSILSLYDFYYMNKKKCELQLKTNDILRALSLEIKNNLSFQFIDKLNKEAIYFLDINNAKDLIENNLEDMLRLRTNTNDEGWNIKVNDVEIDEILNVEISYVNSNSKINYKVKEEVEKFSHIK